MSRRLIIIVGVVHWCDCPNAQVLACRMLVSGARPMLLLLLLLEYGTYSLHHFQCGVSVLGLAQSAVVTHWAPLVPLTLHDTLLE